MSIEHASDRTAEALDVVSEDESGHAGDHVQETDTLEESIQPATRSETSSTRKTSPCGSGCELLAVGGAAAVVAGALLLWRHLSRRSAANGGKAQPVTVKRDLIFSTMLHLPCPDPPQPPAAPHALAGKTLVISDRVAVEGAGPCPSSGAEGKGSHPRPESHAAVPALVDRGAQALALVPSEHRGPGGGASWQDSAAPLPNPAGKGRSNGGGEYGAAVAVAAGHADLALAVDELGSARIPAACCGMYAFRPSSGAFAPGGVLSASPSLAAPCLLAADPALLLKGGEALRVPGGGPRGALASYLVAEDFFSECDPCMRDMVPAVITAVKRWAGPDQAQGLSLCEWLYHRISGLRGFMGGEGGVEEQAGNGTPEQPVRHSRAVLRALGAAAEAVRGWETAHGGEASGGGGDLDHQGPSARPLDHSQPQVIEEKYRAAQGIMAELSTSIRSALQDGYIFVLPSTPGEAPPVGRCRRSGRGGGGAEGEDVEGSFQRRAMEFSALAELAGVPQVVIPLPVPGRLPLSISLMTLHKKDLTLLQAAAKLGPMLAEEAASVAAQQAQQQQQQQQPIKVAKVAGAGGGERKEGRKKDGAKEGLEVDEERKARAEMCKGEGNTAFKAGRYEEAVRQYTAAVQLDPKNHVYYANRALAHLKLGWYGQAEADCDAALQLELNVKALLRRGSARVAQGDAEGAKADFKQALAFEPRNRQAREELAAIQQMEQQMQPGAF